jgi:sialic acid synthase SpsE/mannose-6-phosphate isomerase-like protein (cupin superfamily)
MEIKPIFIFEMANNHSGSVEHAKRIIDEIAKQCTFTEFDYAFKFQYRDLDSFIHKDFKERFDVKNIKRFSETKLSEEQFIEIKEYCESKGFISICTPFDEISVDKVVNHGYKYLKIASCSCTDWPLLEKIAETDLPIILSTAGANEKEIDNVVSFFIHRKKELTIMHCVAEYPTADINMQLNQIDFLKNKYKNIRVGYSTHEDPNNFISVCMAVAKGAMVFEKHVGVETDTIKLNKYSANPEQAGKWLKAAHDAFVMCGIKDARIERTEKEEKDLRALQRAVFAKVKIAKGEEITPDKVYFAIPGSENQILANDLSKYKEFIADRDFEPDSAITFDSVIVSDVRDIVEKIYKDVSAMLAKAGIVLADGSVFELSHHYGLCKYYEFGTTIIECINREYCKKILVVLPGQKHPVHKHIKKEESFQVLYGDIEMNLDGEIRNLTAGDIVTVERGMSHSFSSVNGGIFEEVSSTHYVDDSFYDDPVITANKKRKTKVKYNKGNAEFK